MDDVDAVLAPLRAMVSLLPIEAKHVLARRLHDQLFAPATAGERRIAELGLLAALLDESPQPPGRLPRIERAAYEARRVAEDGAAPRAAVLVERYGSWSRACWAAWGLLADGRNAMGGRPWPQQGRASRFDLNACVDAVRACAAAIGRIPTSKDYTDWARARRRNARDRRAAVDVPLHAVVLRMLAPDRERKNGWRLVIARVFDTPA